jgi:hypothetical protein
VPDLAGLEWRAAIRREALRRLQEAQSEHADLGARGHERSAEALGPLRTRQGGPGAAHQHDRESGAQRSGETSQAVKMSLLSSFFLAFFFFFFSLPFMFLFDQT